MLTSRYSVKDELGFRCEFETRVNELGASLDSCSQRSLAYRFPVMARLFTEWVKFTLKRLGKKKLDCQSGTNLDPLLSPTTFNY